MSGYVINIESESLRNDDFRRVLFTGPHCQLVVMSLKCGEDIGKETHDDVDQFIRVESGQGVAVLNGEKHKLEDGVAVVIPAGVEHNIVNTSNSEAMKLYTIYTPPNHPDGTIHKTRADAVAYEAQHHHSV
jgi:mannose-6-phosphate isomerase-like protein (cupin superfamily)